MKIELETIVTETIVHVVIAVVTIVVRATASQKAGPARIEVHQTFAVLAVPDSKAAARAPALRVDRRCAARAMMMMTTMTTTAIVGEVHAVPKGVATSVVPRAAPGACPASDRPSSVVAGRDLAACPDLDRRNSAAARALTRAMPMIGSEVWSAD